MNLHDSWFSASHDILHCSPTTIPYIRSQLVDVRAVQQMLGTRCFNPISIYFIRHRDACHHYFCNLPDFALDKIEFFDKLRARCATYTLHWIRCDTHVYKCTMSFKINSKQKWWNDRICVMCILRLMEYSKYFCFSPHLKSHTIFYLDVYSVVA